MATKTNKTAFSAAWIRVEDDKLYREVSWEHSSIYDTGTRARQRKLPMKFPCFLKQGVITKVAFGPDVSLLTCTPGGRGGKNSYIEEGKVLLTHSK